MHGSAETTNPEIVWVIAYTGVASNLVMRTLNSRSYKMPRPILLRSVALQYQDVSQLQRDIIVNKSRLCAVILVLEPDGLDVPRFREWVEWCQVQVSQEENFRLFVRFQNMTREDFIRRSNTDPLLGNLADTVQIPDTAGIIQVHESLISYLEQLDDIRDATFRRRLIFWTASVLDPTIGILQGLSLIIALILFGLLIFNGGESIFEGWLDEAKALLAMTAGVTYFPLFILFCFFLFVSLRQKAGDTFIPIGVPIAIVVFHLMLGKVDNMPTSWFLLGVAIGILIDLLRRKANQTRGTLHPIDLEKTTQTGYPLPNPLNKAAKGRLPSPLTYPIWPSTYPIVFISYARYSKWGQQLADRLYNELHKNNVECFLDKHSIAEGSAWHERLNLKLGEANILIALIDNLSVTRKWVAAEMETVLDRKQLTGLPEIVALKSPQLSDNEKEKWFPVFDAVLNQPNYREGQPRLITVKETTVSALVSDMRPQNFQSISIVPKWVAGILQGLILPWTVLPVKVGTYGTKAGWIAGILGMLQWLNIIEIVSFLSSWWLLLPLSLLCGYWVGFTAWLTFYSYFDFKYKERKIKDLVWINLVATVGFIILLASWYLEVHALVIGWTIVFCGIGWILGNSFTYLVGLRKPEIKRLNN